MVLTVEELKQTAKKIGSLGVGDCFYAQIFEVWQKDDAFYQREIYYSGDDEGYDRVTEITKEQAEGLIEEEEFYKENNVTGGLKAFMRDNWNTCKSYAEHFAGDICQAAEYLYNQI